jgi:hypothetical protein
MARYVKVATAQMGLNNEGTSREEIVDQMTPARKRRDFFGPRHAEHDGLVTQPVRKDG